MTHIISVLQKHILLYAKGFTMRFLNSVCIGFIFIFTMQSCHDDVVEEVEIIDTFTPYTIYEVDINGLISNDSGEPITEAALSFGIDTKLSDELGYFSFEGVPADTRDAILRVTADGFLPATRRITVLSPNTINLNITLIPIPDEESFSAEDGKVVNVSDRAQLTFFPNGITKNGEPYSGNVNLKSYHLAKDDEQLYKKLPGDLIGVDQQQDLTLLETYGMLYAILEDDAGNELQPDASITAQIKIDIPEVDRAQAPNEIPMWYFDDNQGLWIEEGIALKENNSYVAEVTHFSWWNIDVPLGELITVCIEATDVSTGLPLKNTDVFFRSGGIEFGSQITNNDGKLCVSVPSQRVITLSLNSSCQYTSSSEIGPFEQSTDDVQVELGTNEANTITINGSVSDCDGQPLLVDIISVSRNGNRSAIETTGDGTYNYSVVCPVDNEKINFLVYNKATESAATEEFTVNSGVETSQFDIAVCGNDSQDILIATIEGEELILLIESVTQNPNETILVLDNGCYLSFLGNQTGTFEGGYFCLGANPNVKADVTVTSFGNQIKGTFSGNNIAGSFNASNN